MHDNPQGEVVSDKREKFVQQFRPVRVALLRMDKKAMLAERLRIELGWTHDIVEPTLMANPSGGSVYLSKLRLAVFDHRVRYYTEVAAAENSSWAIAAMNGCINDANLIEAVMHAWRRFYKGFDAPDYIKNRQIKELYREVENALPSR